VAALKQPEETVLRFNEFINSGDIEGLGGLLVDGHRFTDSAGNIFKGKESALKAWREFFRLFPGYKNVFENIRSREGLVIIKGRSVSLDERRNGPALWTAKVEEGKIAEWRVYEDTKENRRRLGIA